MIKWLTMLLFGKQIEEEKEKALAEIRKLLEDTKASELKKTYVYYERFAPNTPSFLHGIEPVINNKFVLSWLNEHRFMNIEQMKIAMAANDKDRIMNGLAQIAMIDTLLLDINTFDIQYKNLLNQKKEERDE